MLLNKRKSPLLAQAVQTAPSVSPFSALNSYVPLAAGEHRLYAALREAVPVIDAAIDKIVRLVGGFTVKCGDQGVEDTLNFFLQNIKANSVETGAQSFLNSYLSQLLTYGNAVGEMVMSGGSIAALYNAGLDDVELKAVSPLQTDIYRREPGGSMRVKYPELVFCSALNPPAGSAQGVSLLHGLPFVSGILVQIYNTIGVNWERLGNVRFAVTYKPTGDGQCKRTVYITTQEAILPQGELSVTVPAKAEQGGRIGNTQPGTVTIMMTPPPAIESVTNSAAFIGGEDSEGDSQLRSRLMQSYAGFSNGANVSFYREFALKYDGVYSVGVVPRESGAGTVGVYLGGRGGVPPQEITSKVQSDLNEQREINVTVTVAAAQTVPVNIDITVTPAQYVTMEEAKSACAQAVTDYFSALSVGEPVILAALGVPILATGKIKNYVFTSSVTTDRKMNANQLAVCGTMNITSYAEES